MTIFARINAVGWVHLWPTREAYEEGEASVHFFNGRTDPRWLELELTLEQQRGLEAGELVALEDPGFLDEPEGSR
jgi:hypothetical protein